MTPVRPAGDLGTDDPAFLGETGAVGVSACVPDLPCGGRPNTEAAPRTRGPACSPGPHPRGRGRSRKDSAFRDNWGVRLFPQRAKQEVTEKSRGLQTGAPKCRQRFAPEREARCPRPGGRVLPERSRWRRCRLRLLRTSPGRAGGPEKRLALRGRSLAVHGGLRR